MNSEQIAKLAGVSRSTVSKVLHNYPDIPEVTRQRVLKVVQEHNYRPNAMAQALKGLSPKIISAYLYTQHQGDSQVEASTHYNMSFLVNLALESRRRGYSVNVEVISGNDRPKDIVAQVADAFKFRRMGTAVFVGLTDECSFIEDIISLPHHVIVLDKEIDTTCGARSIFANDCKSAKLACEHLYNQGYTNLMHVAGDMSKLSGKERCKGYLEAVKERGLHAPKILKGAFSYNDGYLNGKQFLEQKLYEEYDGVVFGNDMMGHGFVDYLREHQPELVDQLGMIGFDNDPLDLYKKPTLSTMAMDFANLAHIIINLEQNYEQYSGGISLNIDHQLIKRESSMPKAERSKLLL